MYTEGFESLEEMERESRSNYGGNSETDRLLRENEKLKKSLEKEQFFNKLLDQEIQEMKMSMSGGERQEFHSEYWSGSRGVSRGAFWFVLLLAVGMAGYIGYGIYHNKPMNYLGLGKSSRPATVLQNDPASPTAVVTTPANSSEVGLSEAAASGGSDNGGEAITNDNAGSNVSAQPNNQADNNKPTARETARSAAAAPAAAKDSVPNIIGGKKFGSNSAPSSRTSQKASVIPAADQEYNEDEVNAAINDNETSDNAPVAQKPATDNRPVIARYKVTSKANFYNEADENTMRGTFISGSANKVVDALDEKNGFIYVVYTNDLGYTSRGWLSKQDLTKE